MKSNVTAIIPVYNGKRYLREAVESVIQQTLPPDQLIIIDDGSTDGSLEALAGLESPVPITVVTQPNAGQAAARNRGVFMAQTEFIALLDQDDRWYPGHVEVLARMLHEHPEAGWVYSNCDAVDEDGKMLIQGMLDAYPFTHPKRDLRICLSEDMFILPSASMIRKKAFDEVGGFDERFSGYEDDDLFLRLFVAGWGNEYIREPHSIWRIHKTSTLHSHRMVKSRRIYAEKLIAAFPDRTEPGDYLVRDCIAPRFITMNMQQYERGLIIGDLSFCREALADIRKFAPLCRRDPVRSVMMFFMRFPWVLRLFLHGWHLATRIIKLPFRLLAGRKKRGTNHDE